MSQTYSDASEMPRGSGLGRDDTRGHPDTGQPQPQVLADERAFYDAHDWCLDPFPSVAKARGHLRREIERLETAPPDWRAREIATNIVLLSCALANAVEEHLRGQTLRMPRKVASMRAGRLVRAAAEVVTTASNPWRRGRLQRWHDRWQAALDDVLAQVLAPPRQGQAADLARQARALVALLDAKWPARLLATPISIPSPFRRQDLTLLDVVALAEALAASCPDRAEPLLLLGLRTSGSYFVPVVRATLKAAGYTSTASVTIQPDKGPGAQENAIIKRAVARGGHAVILDDSPHSAGTLHLAFDLCRRAGFPADKIKVVAPTHPARRNWTAGFPAHGVLTLEPENWHKQRLLDVPAVQTRLSEYYGAAGFADIRVQATDDTRNLEATARSASTDPRVARLKRIFEVAMRAPDGREQRRYVLAKSVGWGWLGYHAFLCGQRLASFVPPLLGLRDGILYSEWVAPVDGEVRDRAERIETAADYVAARVRHLRIERDGTEGGANGLQRHQDGLKLLEEALAKAYGPLPAAALMRPRVHASIARSVCPVPTLIDGRMAQAEWIAGPRSLLKTDYEHHGMGKGELNLDDPAYDLAETIMDLALSSSEEAGLVARYVAQSGDDGIGQRLPMHKLLAGLWAMSAARKQMFADPRDRSGQLALHGQFMRAWDFLTVHGARACGARIARARQPTWNAPLVVLDIDGVIDRRVFGFPCTTAAGIEALSVLHAAGASVALDTARSLPEVREYCQAYSLSGGVAEHGACLWDAVNDRAQVLVGDVALRQLEILRQRLKQIPGVFLDDRHQYSIRAFAYREAPRGLVASLVPSNAAGVGHGPLSTLLMQDVFGALKLDRLSFHHTSIDTTIVARGCDKGTGLVALRDLTVGPRAETIAVGDSEPDLAMFRVATRGFAPAHIGCAREARLLGCRIAAAPYQRGFLEIVTSLFPSPSGAMASASSANAVAEADRGQDWLIEVLRAADQSSSSNLLRAVARPSHWRVLLR